MKKTFVSLEQVVDIATVYPTPFHIYDERGIRENVRQLKTAFDWNGGYKEYFAVKANANPFILKILKEEGCGVDCSSYTELLLAKAVGFEGDDIMFSSNATPLEDFKLCKSLNGIINLDDISHIDFLESLGDLPKTISCRFNSGEFAYGNDIMSMPKDSKYGFTYEQLVEGFNLLAGKGVESFGIHALLASNTEDDQYYPELAKLLFETAVDIKKDTGISLSFINLSGGIGIAYKPDETSRDILAIGNRVKSLYKEILVANDLGDVKIYNELGRFVLGPFGGLVTKAIHEKHIYKDYINVDACSVDLLRPAMYGAYHHISVLGKDNLPQDHVYDVAGGLCENNDKFAVDRSLPQINTGDYLFIHDTGAHGYAMGYNYNGKLKSAELLLQTDGSIKLIRRAEKPEDYFVTLNYPGL